MAVLGGDSLPAASDNAGRGVTGKLRDAGRFILNGEWLEAYPNSRYVASDGRGPFEHRLAAAGSTA